MTGQQWAMLTQVAMTSAVVALACFGWAVAERIDGVKAKRRGDQVARRRYDNRFVAAMLGMLLGIIGIPVAPLLVWWVVL
jgi:hypothetical protein